MMETKEIYQKLHQFVNEVSLGYKGTIDLNLLRGAADRLEELESKQENLIDYNADLNNRLDKAESHIEKLEKQLSEKQPEWISVEDRLPKEKDMVLAFAMDKDHRFAFLSDDENWYNSNGFLELNITHWMPLPEPPKPKEPTFKDVFLKAFPKAQKYDEGTPIACAEDVFPQVKRHDHCDGRCDKCWNLPYFEPEGEGEADA